MDVGYYVHLSLSNWCFGGNGDMNKEYIHLGPSCLYVSSIRQENLSQMSQILPTNPDFGA